MKAVGAGARVAPGSGSRLPPNARARGSRRATRSNAQTFDDYVQELQKDMLSRCEAADGSGSRFRVDEWERERGEGFGRTCVLEDGDLFEKAAVNVSVIRDVLSAERASAMSERGRGTIDRAGGQPYEAEALSLVFHPRSPLVPTLRADVRRFRVGDAAWYGGGCDITPSYLDEELAREFHRYWRSVCDRHSPEAYQKFKAWCDPYFYIPARGEHRGLGGIFFDDLEEGGGEAYDVSAFARDFSSGILDSWLPLALEANRQEFTKEQKEWQLLRRGRYVEFNLLYDRGIKFGLGGGRMESIMVSAPPSVKWRYDARPEDGSEEDRLLRVLSGEPREWAV